MANNFSFAFGARTLHAYMPLADGARSLTNVLAIATGMAPATNLFAPPAQTMANARPPSFNDYHSQTRFDDLPKELKDKLIGMQERFNAMENQRLELEEEIKPSSEDALKKLGLESDLTMHRCEVMQRELSAGLRNAKALLSQWEQTILPHHFIYDTLQKHASSNSHGDAWYGGGGGTPSPYWSEMYKGALERLDHYAKRLAELHTIHQQHYGDYSNANVEADGSDVALGQLEETVKFELEYVVQNANALRLLQRDLTKSKLDYKMWLQARGEYRDPFAAEEKLARDEAERKKMAGDLQGQVPVAPVAPVAGQGATATAATTTTAAPAPMGAFNFGTAQTAAATPAAGGFKFGAPQATTATPAAAGAFNFGAPQATTATPAATPAVAGAFGFGAPQAATPAAGAFSFGAPQATTATPGATPAAGAFSFGAPQATTATPAATPAAAGAFSFGAPQAAAPGGGGFSFGAPQAAAPGGGGFSFGAPQAAPSGKNKKRG